MIIKIPVLVAYIIVHSRNMEKINILTKIILHLIYEGININRLKEIIKLPHRLIIEHIYKLEKDGIIVKDSEENYRLTEIGYKNFNLLNQIEELNKKQVKVLVDKHTKQIFKMEDIEDRYIANDTALNEESVQLKSNNYIKQYLQNLNPSNSKAVALTMLNGLDDYDRESIEIEIKMSNEKGGYILGKLKSNITKTNKKSKMATNVLLKRQIFKNEISFDFNSLRQYDNKKLEAIKSLKGAIDLFSAKGVEVIEKLEVKENKEVVYYDAKHNTISNEKIKTDVTDKEISTSTIIPDNTITTNISKECLPGISEKIEKYGNDLKVNVKVTKENIYEKYSIEDVIDVYEKVILSE